MPALWSRCALPWTRWLWAGWWALLPVGALARSVTVDDTGPAIKITIVLEFCPDGVTQAQMRQFVDAHKAEVAAIWQRNTGPLRPRPGAPAQRIEVNIEYAFLETCDEPRRPDRYRFRLHPGRPPAEEGRNASAGELFLENTSRTVAHEIGHALGLDDEYQNHGPTAENLMGRGGNRTVTASHLLTLLFLHLGNPDDAGMRCRRLLKALLRLFPRVQARQMFADNDCPAALFDQLTGLLDANGGTVQPPPPSH